MPQKNLPDADYTLTEGAAWIEVGGFAIRIAKTDEGVVADIYKSGAEADCSLASCYAFDAELED